ncbi:MAG: hypothetical protein ACRDVM_04550 [Acidimicrobiia bacterium]
MRADQLPEALADLGTHLQYPEVPDLAGPVSARVGPSPDRRRRWLVPAAPLAGLAVVMLLLFPAARQAVAGWLGLGGVRITFTDELPPELQLTLGLGDPVDLEEAVRRAGFPVMVPTDPALGPGALFVGPSGVTLVWPASEALPAAPGTGAGLVIVQFRAAGDILEKLLGPGTTVEVVEVRGEPGYWISGAPHMVGPADGEPGRRAAHVLLWVEDGTTIRLEGAFDLERALSLAAGLRPEG